MRILKAINNNVVSAVDQEGREVIVTGKGIGFRALPGDLIPTPDIEKVFRMENQNLTEKLKDLFASLPMQHMRLSDTIITYATEKLGMHLNQSIYITLTDHISFSVKRFQQGHAFTNPLLMEVRRFYPQEFIIGQYALELIERELKVTMPVDEAASIALHIVNAEYDSPTMNQTLSITRHIQAILDVVKGFEDFDFDASSMDYERFITHLKYLTQRIYQPEAAVRTDPAFVVAIETIYPREAALSARLAAFIEQSTGHCLSPEERAYLTVHLKRIARQEQAST